MKNTLFNTKSELFKAAHKVTKLVLSFNVGADYKITFGQVLKAMSSFHLSSKETKLKGELYTNSKMPVQFQKSVLEITTKVNAGSKFDVEVAANFVINSIPQKQAIKKVEETVTAEYYSNGKVTMC